VFLEEAQWLRAVLEDLELPAESVMLDIGSATEVYRRVFQPYVDYEIFRPLRKRGVSVVHVDARDDVGVDVVLDVTAGDGDESWERLGQADVVMCCNMLEHVLDRALVLRRLKDRVKPGGVLILTVPHRCRYHLDPIDTMYRPDDRELAALFPEDDFEVVRSGLVDISEDTPSRPSSGWVPESLLGSPISLRTRVGVKVTTAPVRLTNRVLSALDSRFRLEIAEHFDNQVAVLAVRRR
jgi:SAM-dependent methyltransferase